MTSRLSYSQKFSKVRTSDHNPVTNTKECQGPAATAWLLQAKVVAQLEWVTLPWRQHSHMMGYRCIGASKRGLQFMSDFLSREHPETKRGYATSEPLRLYVALTEVEGIGIVFLRKASFDKIFDG